MAGPRQQLACPHEREEKKCQDLVTKKLKHKKEDTWGWGFVDAATLGEDVLPAAHVDACNDVIADIKARHRSRSDSGREERPQRAQMPERAALPKGQDAPTMTGTNTSDSPT